MSFYKLSRNFYFPLIVVGSLVLGQFPLDLLKNKDSNHTQCSRTKLSWWHEKSEELLLILKIYFTYKCSASYCLLLETLLGLHGLLMSFCRRLSISKNVNHTHPN